MKGRSMDGRKDSSLDIRIFHETGQARSPHGDIAMSSMKFPYNIRYWSIITPGCILGGSSEKVKFLPTSFCCKFVTSGRCLDRKQVTLPARVIPSCDDGVFRGIGKARPLLAPSGEYFNTRLAMHPGRAGKRVRYQKPRGITSEVILG